MSWEQAMAVVNVNFVGGMSVIHGAPAAPGDREVPVPFHRVGFCDLWNRHPCRLLRNEARRAGTDRGAVDRVGPYGVRAMDILPGIIDTGMLSTG